MTSFLRRLSAAASIAAVVWALVGPYRRLLVLAGITALGTGIADAYVVVLAVATIMPMLGQTELPALFSMAAATTGSASEPSLTFHAVVLLTAGLVARQMIAAAIRSLNVLLSARVSIYLQGEILAQLLEARFSHLDTLRSGGFRHIVATESAKTVAAIRSMVLVISNTFSLLVSIGLLIHFSPILSAGLAVLALMYVPVWVSALTLLHRVETRNVSNAMQAQNVLNEILLSIRVIKIQNRQASSVAQFRSHTRAAERTYLLSNMLKAWEPVSLQVIVILGAMLIIFVAERFAVVPLATALAFFLMVYRAMPAASGLNIALNDLVAQRPHVMAVAHHYRLDPVLHEPIAGIDLGSPPRKVAFENVSFDYGSAAPVLRHVNLDLRSGEAIAIIGGSGAGKSTVAALLLGMYQPSGGSIRIDGAEASTLALPSLRRHMSWVPQDLHIANTTIGEFISAGDRAITQEAIESAARVAEIHEFIVGLPAGYETTTGERGLRLSGGQRQRLLIAQAVARRSGLLILDEATSALDAPLAEQVLRNLNQLRKTERSMLIAITHRFTGLESFERIYLLEEGRVVESGSYEALLAARGPFYRLWLKYSADDNLADRLPPASIAAT